MKELKVCFHLIKYRKDNAMVTNDFIHVVNC